MNLFEAFGVIKLKDEGFSSGISMASNKFSKFAGSAIKGTVGFTTSIVKGMAVGATAAAGFGVAAVKVGMDFESSMAQVAATIGITADRGNADYKKLSNAAKDAGATTKFSAGEAAEALNYMALAGMSVDESVSTMPKVLNLASAGNMDLAYASDLVTDSMSALGLEMDDVDSFINQMAKTSQKTNTSIDQLGEGMLTVGGTAKLLNGGTVELSTSLGILADSGIKGAEGGTKLRNILMSLSTPTSSAGAAMQSLGLDVFDLEGNMRPLPDVMGDLNSAMDSMTDQQKVDIINKIFNKQDMAAVQALLGTTSEEWENLSSAIEDSEGTAKNMSDTMQNNLKGALTTLKSAASVFAIDFYENIDTPLKGGVQSVTDFVNSMRNEMNSMSGAVQDGTMTSGDAMNSFADSVGTGISGMILDLAKNIPQMIDVGKNLIIGFVNGLTSNVSELAKSASEIITAFFGALKEIFPQLAPLGVEIISTLLEGIIANYEFIFTSGVELITKLIQGIAKKMPELIPQALSAIKNIVDGLKTNFPLLIEAAVKIIGALLDGIVKALPDIIKGALLIVESLLDGLIAAAPQILEAGLKMLAQLALGLAEALPSLMPKIVELIQNIVNVFVENMDMFISAGITLFTAIIDALPIILPAIVEAILTLVISVIGALISSYPQLLVAAYKLFGSLLSSLDGIIDEIPTALIKLIKTIITSIGNWYVKIREKARELFMQIPKSISGIFGNLGTKLSEIKTKILTTIGGWLVILGVKALALFMKIPQAISGIFGSLGSGLSNVVTKILTTIGGWLGKISNKALELFKKIPESIPKMLGQLGNAVSTIWTKISTAMSGFVGKMKNIGTDMIKGLLNGIGSMAKAVVNKAKDVVKGALDAVKGFLKIGSPSKLMHQIGAWTTEGLADGIKSQEDMLIKSAKNTVKGVTSAFENLANSDYELNFGINGVGNLVPSEIQAESDLQGDFGVGKGINVTQNIYATPQTPSDLIAEARRQLEWEVLLGV